MAAPLWPQILQIRTKISQLPWAWRDWNSDRMSPQLSFLFFIPECEAMNVYCSVWRKISLAHPLGRSGKPHEFGVLHICEVPSHDTTPFNFHSTASSESYHLLRLIIESLGPHLFTYGIDVVEACHSGHQFRCKTPELFVQEMSLR